jgi:inhibitor of cysteine peptidase
MFTKFTLTIITIILLASLAGCGAINQSNPSPSPNNSQSSASENVTDTTAEDNYQMLPVISGKVANMKLDASASGSIQQFKKGEVISITLESNPSTGYAWYASISDTNIIVQMGEPEYTEPNSSTTPLVGAAGTQTFFFQGVDTGTATITMDYKRGWETDVAPIQTMTIIVEVQ